MSGKVYLVGAGPGDPGLISVKGLECIKTAEVIIYDHLANPKLLSYARPEAELIYVGKTGGDHTLPQEQINQLLIEKAQSGKTVCRLKGGDPCVFGRGGEEAEELVAAGLEFEFIPGITSAIAVPAYAGIPVTHREYTSTFAVITGHEDPTKDSSSIQWEKLATSVGTLVFLMGVGNLPLIVEQLIKYGRPKDTPVALIRHGTLPKQETLIGTLADIAAKAKQQKFKPPAIIIVGEVVKLRKTLNWFENKPLFGKRILVTRTRKQASEFAEQLESLGAEVNEFPTIEIIPPDDWKPVDKAIKNLPKYDWVIFTSANGVEKFFDRLAEKKLDCRQFKNAQLAAIGPATAEALKEKGFIADIVPSEYRAEGIIEAFAPLDLSRKKILLARALEARDILPEQLKQRGAKVDVVPVYKTIKPVGAQRAAPDKLKSLDVITFASSSSVRNFVEMFSKEEFKEIISSAAIAVIGPITAQTARELGLPIAIEATEYTIPGLVTAIRTYFKK
ncbi:MAG: uroporphyrinogen-III C-methyltransferase [bacterium]|nr:uroporphyrinogen-III C-methyltransferase [bacterium]